MSRVYQTKFPPASPAGNCLAACFASLLDVPLADVPNIEVLEAIPGALWSIVLNAWLAHNGYVLEEHRELLDYHSGHVIFPDELEDCPYLASGTVAGQSHACIYANGRLVHDPTPAGAGLDVVEGVYLLRGVSPGPQVAGTFLRWATVDYSTVPQIPDF